jgi:hypothetical protein
VRAVAFRLIALVLVLLAASPFTAPFSAHNQCEAQYKDAASADKVVSDVALTPVPLLAIRVETEWRRAVECPAGRLERHEMASTVLRL